MKLKKSRPPRIALALAGLFPPVEIDDIYYVDGALKKTMHAYQQTRQMLRSNKTGLSEKLWRHAIANLQEIMDDLGHVVRTAAHKSSPSW